MSRRQQGLYKPADLSYFIGELRRTAGRAGQGRANFWHTVRIYLQQRPKRS